MAHSLWQSAFTCDGDEAVALVLAEPLPARPVGELPEGAHDVEGAPVDGYPEVAHGALQRRVRDADEPSSGNKLCWDLASSSDGFRVPAAMKTVRRRMDRGWSQ